MLIITQAQHILTYLRFATVVLQNIWYGWMNDFF
jgi:hypothetical protein